MSVCFWVLVSVCVGFCLWHLILSRVFYFRLLVKLKKQTARQQIKKQHRILAASGIEGCFLKVVFDGVVVAAATLHMCVCKFAEKSV